MPLPIAAAATVAGQTIIRAAAVALGIAFRKSIVKIPKYLVAGTTSKQAWHVAEAILIDELLEAIADLVFESVNSSEGTTVQLSDEEQAAVKAIMKKTVERYVRDTSYDAMVADFGERVAAGEDAGSNFGVGE
jgi:hypothetical protein